MPNGQLWNHPPLAHKMPLSPIYLTWEDTWYKHSITAFPDWARSLSGPGAVAIGTAFVCDRLEGLTCGSDLAGLLPV